MNKVVIATAVALFLASFPVQAAQNLTCDQAALTKIETDIGSMSGKDAKKASKQLDKAKQAFKDGNSKKCASIMKKLQASLKSSPAPAAVRPAASVRTDRRGARPPAGGAAARLNPIGQSLTRTPPCRPP